MKKKIASLVFLFVSVLGHNTIAQNSISPRYVVLISIDGLRPDHYLDKSWYTPNLQFLKSSGGYLDSMTSVFPSFTYPSHVAMLTGAMPARSGISYNQIPNSSKWYWEASSIKVPTLWDVLNERGLSTAAIQWPCTVGANIDYNIPEIWNPEFPSDRITESRKYSTKGLIEEIEATEIGPLTSVNMDEGTGSLDSKVGEIAAYIFRKYQPSFLAVHFASVDGKQHDHGLSDLRVYEALKNVDKALGKIRNAIVDEGKEDETAIIVVGDHGFADNSVLVRPNVFLKLEGARFQSAGGAAFLYSTSGNVNASTSEFLTKVGDVADSLRSRFTVIDRRELDVLGVDSSVLLALAGIPGTVFSSSTSGDQMQVLNTGGHHGYDPRFPEMKTGFIVSCKGCFKGRKVERFTVADIATIIASLLNVPFSAPDAGKSSDIISETK